MRPTPLRLAFALLLAAAPPARAQTSDLAVSWSAAERWLVGQPGEAGSDPGAARGRASGLCRSTVLPEGDVPVVLRIDSTETTLAGRAGGSGLITGVGDVQGAAYDVSDPAQPRRLNLLFRDAPVSDGVWTPEQGENLYVMASPYDGTGQTYAGRNVRTQDTDCLYVVRTQAEFDVSAYTPNPLEMRIRPAYVRSATATRGDDVVDLGWAYDRPEGTAFRVLRSAEGAEPEAVVATVPLSARTYRDAAVLPDGLYTYRVEVAGPDGAALHTSRRPGPVRPGAVERMTLVGSLATGRSTSDIWGYVGPGGREYAVLNSSGLTMIDVTDPVPVEVAYVPGGDSDIEVFGHYAYVSGNGAPVQVIDIADPAAPVVVRTFAGHPDAPLAGVHTLSVADGYLYLNGNVGGFSIWSLADPSDPVYVGAYRDAYAHDVYVRNDTLYGALIYGGGVDVLDISDKAHPVRIANVNYPGSGAHNVCMTEDGSHIFVGDEIGTGPWTRVFDVRDPQNVELVAEIVVDPRATVHNCHVRGDLLYLGHYSEGIRVWDVSDPAAPVEVAFYNSAGVSSTDEFGQMFGFTGIWTAWPFLPSGKILASDRTNGLLVLRLDDGVAGEPAPTAPAAAALQVAPNPSAGAVRFSFALAAAGPARLSVLDALGREVAVVSSGLRPAGPHEVRWETRALPAGVYVARLVTADGPRTQRLTVAR